MRCCWYSVIGLVLVVGCGSSKSSDEGGKGDKGKDRRIVGAVSARSPMAPAPDPKANAAVTKTGTVEEKPDETDEADEKRDATASDDKSLYSKWVRSLRLRRAVSVRFEPKENSKLLGTIQRGTRVMWKSATKGSGCETRWIEIEPYGWICERFLAPSRKPPVAEEHPKLERGAILPSLYGRVVLPEDKKKKQQKKKSRDSDIEDIAKANQREDSDEDPAEKKADDHKAKTYKLEDGKMVEARKLEGNVTVRLYGDKPRTVDGKRYWNIGKREYLPEENVRMHKPSDLHGVRVGDDTGIQLPIAFASNHVNYGHKVTVYKTKKLRRPVRYLPPRSVVKVLERVTKRNGRSHAYRIGENQWVQAREMHVARKKAPPPGTLPTERWFDVDLNEQVIVAYEGTTPVYTALVSTGVRKHATPEGIYRVWLKYSETPMTGQMAGEDPYAVADVPWVQYYAKDFALHTAYWHNVFGLRTSHGCVNLTPIDSRFLYFWSDPQVPPGWTMANGHEQRPGSMVRVRSRKVPNPEFQGYAKAVYEARKAKSSR